MSDYPLWDSLSWVDQQARIRSVALIVKGMGKGCHAQIISATPYTYEGRVVGGRYDGCVWTFNRDELKIEA